MLLPIVEAIVEARVSSETTLGERILFSAYYVVEVGVFSVPALVVVLLESHFETKLHDDLRRNVFRMSRDRRLVLRFAKGTSHKIKAHYMAYAVYHFLWPRLPFGASHRYDLHVLPWEIKTQTLTVQCSNCDKEVMVRASLTHFRCTQCLACLSMGLPTLKENEYRSRPATTVVERQMTKWASEPCRTLRNRTQAQA